MAPAMEVYDSCGLRFEGREPDITEETCRRIRGNLMMALSNKLAGYYHGHSQPRLAEWERKKSPNPKGLECQHPN